MPRQNDGYFGKDSMNSIDADPELVEYLELSARDAGISVATLLRQVLHVNPLTEKPRLPAAFRHGRK